MKIHSIIIALLFSFHLLQAQSTKKVDSFSSIEISGSISLTLIKSKIEKVDYEIVKGDANKFTISSKGSTLILSTQNSGYSNGDIQVKATVYFDKIDDIEISSGVTVNTEDYIEAKQFDLEVSSGSSCTLLVISDSADIEVDSGSSLTISGKSDSADIEVGSGSSLRADKFDVNDIDIEASSGSSAKVRANRSISAEASSGSSISYYGKANQVDLESDISSGISKKK